MPIVAVTYGPQVEEALLFRLGEMLPHEVSVAVECPEEPYDHPLQPGDVEIRFRPREPFDIGGLDILVEVRSKWFASRVATRQEKCDRLRDAIFDATGATSVGVYLSMPVAAWSLGRADVTVVPVRPR